MLKHYITFMIFYAIYFTGIRIKYFIYMYEIILLDNIIYNFLGMVKKTG
jgi:hypothetical protein